MDSKEERKKSKKLYWGIVGICLICWLPYFLTLYPGVVTWDSEWQVEQAIGVSSYSNHQPWIQTLMIKFCCFLGKLISDSINTGVAIYVMFQMCVLALIYAYVIYYLYQNCLLYTSMSSDRTRVLMEKFAEEENGFLRVKVFDNPKKKQAAGWNIAIKNSSEDIIIRIDAHTMIPLSLIHILYIRILQRTI